MLDLLPVTALLAVQRLDTNCYLVVLRSELENRSHRTASPSPGCITAAGLGGRIGPFQSSFRTCHRPRPVCSSSMGLAPASASSITSPSSHPDPSASSFKRPLVTPPGPLDHLKILNSGHPFLLCDPTHSQVPGTRKRASLRGHYSTSHKHLGESTQKTPEARPFMWPVPWVAHWGGEEAKKGQRPFSACEPWEDPGDPQPVQKCLTGCWCWSPETTGNIRSAGVFINTDPHEPHKWHMMGRYYLCFKDEKNRGSEKWGVC